MRHLTYLIFLASFVLESCGNQNDKSITNIIKKESVNNINFKENFNYSHINHIERDTNSIKLSEFIVVNEDFEYILDTLIEMYNLCEQRKDGRHFSISITDAKITDSLGVKHIYLSIDSLDTKDSLCAKKLYISESYYKDFVSRGYGFFYHNDYLFVLEGQLLENLFKEKNKTQLFPYKCEPVNTFDPPRWLYCFLNKEFYLVDSSPCGG